MDRMTAIRTFAQPSYTPTRHVRIYANRWYLVTMQNVERDGLTDYMGLASGEYTELLPGSEARARRDAHLNHCNAVRQYDGPVYQVDDIRYAGRVYRTTYIADKAHVDALRERQLLEEHHAASESARHLAHYTTERALYASSALITRYPTMAAETRTQHIAMLDKSIAGMTDYANAHRPWALTVSVIRA